jgi:uncharacterized membrane protein
MTSLVVKSAPAFTLAQEGGPTVSPWLALPLATLAMIALAGYVLSLKSPGVPTLRRRLRTASGVLMMILMGLLAFASAIVPTHDRRLMVLSWMLVVVVLGVVVLLACVDVLTTITDALRERQDQRRAAAKQIKADIRRARDAAPPGTEP